MSNRSTIIIGSLIILVGFISLINALFHINLWDYFWPVVLICLGTLLLLRPQMVMPGTQVRFIPLGDIQRSGPWQVTPEEIWTFVGDIDLLVRPRSASWVLWVMSASWPHRAWGFPCHPGRLSRMAGRLATKWRRFSPRFRWQARITRLPSAKYAWKPPISFSRLRSPRYNLFKVSGGYYVRP